MDESRCEPVTALGARIVGDADGVPVILHPSLGRGPADFDPLVAALAGRGYRTVAVEPRTSAGPPVTLHELAADLVDTASQLGLGPVHAIGHAFGNRVVRCLATDRPSAVRTLTLLGAGGLVGPDRDTGAAIQRCFALEGSEPERVADLQKAFFAPRSDATAWLDGWIPGAVAVQSAAMRRTKREEWWNGGSAPILVVQGLDDRAAPPENGRRLAAERADVELVEVEHAGHALLCEQPDAVAQAVGRFLDAHS